MTYKELTAKMGDGIEKVEGNAPGTRAYRNNNPGNLWDGLSKGKVKRIFPKIAIDSQGFLIYPDYKTGRAALEKDILIKVLSGLTLEQFIYKYAPPNENSTEHYIKLMEEFTKIDRKQKLKDLIT